MITTILSYHIVNIKAVKKFKTQTYSSGSDVTILMIHGTILYISQFIMIS